MRQYIDENIIANQLKMRRSLYKGSFLLLEGRSDQKFYENLIDSEQCAIEIAPQQAESNRKLIVNTMKKLNADNFKGALAIVDRDFEALQEKPIELENLLLTDDHDLEVLLIRSEAFIKVIREYLSSERTNTKGTSTTIQDYEVYREKIAKIAFCIGLLRWISLRDQLNLRFSDLENKYKNFINKRTLLFDKNKFVETVKNHSQETQILNSLIHEKIEELEQQNLDVWQICCGHDLTAIFAFAMRFCWGTNNANKLKKENIEQDLRLAYERHFFQKTQIFRLIKDWGNRNSYTILSHFNLAN